MSPLWGRAEAHAPHQVGSSRTTSRHRGRIGRRPPSPALALLMLSWSPPFSARCHMVLLDPGACLNLMPYGFSFQAEATISPTTAATSLPARLSRRRRLASRSIMPSAPWPPCRSKSSSATKLHPWVLQC
jgi:hypothetical protein